MDQWSDFSRVRGISVVVGHGPTLPHTKVRPHPVCVIGASEVTHEMSRIVRIEKTVKALLVLKAYCLLFLSSTYHTPPHHTLPHHTPLITHPPPHTPHHTPLTTHPSSHTPHHTPLVTHPHHTLLTTHPSSHTPHHTHSPSPHLPSHGRITRYTGHSTKLSGHRIHLPLQRF